MSVGTETLTAAPKEAVIDKMPSDASKPVEGSLHASTTATQQGPVSAQPAAIQWPLTSFASTPHNIACIAFLLGALWSVGLVASSNFLTGKYLVWTKSATIVQPSWAATFSSPALGMYASSFAIFHLLEFVVTSIWNPAKLSVQSYLLDNGTAYNLAHALGLIEYLLEERYLKNEWRAHKHSGYLFLAGFVFLVGGQILRSFAMITASSNFSHMIARKRLPTHELVTHGIYAWSRHPSYAGFFWWACGTQIMLGNPVSTLAFAVILFSFFSNRIRIEEKLLIDFFGQAYLDYKKKVPTRILFIR